MKKLKKDGIYIGNHLSQIGFLKPKERKNSNSRNSNSLSPKHNHNNKSNSPII